MPSSIASRPLHIHAAAPRLSAFVARRLLFAALRSLRHGQVTIADGERHVTFGHASQQYPVKATITVHDSRFYAAAAFGGSVGCGESFMRGEWTCDDLTAVCRLVVKNRDLFNSIDGPWTAIVKLCRSISHRLARNTKSGSRRNIAAHYDLSNEFFSLWLDPTMMYSCAIYKDSAGPIPPTQLERAQLSRLDTIRDRLALSAADDLLEIGTGWGGLAVHLAKSTGCRVTTTTISKEQAASARGRVLAAGLQDRVTVIEQDYRDLMGSFDKLVCIEMVEAVGPQFLDTYFRSCASLLKPSGLFMLQAIVIQDCYYEEGVNWVDFIKKHIFPGSFIPSRSVLTASAHRAGFDLIEATEIGPHYATTLAEWRRRFFASLPAIKGLGFDDTFVRMWEFYLSYCEAGFAESHLGNAQMLLKRRG